MHPLDQLLILRAQEAVEPTAFESERNTDIRRLEREAAYMPVCLRSHHDELCERPVGHDGNCAAVIIF